MPNAVRHSNFFVKAEISTHGNCRIKGKDTGGKFVFVAFEGPVGISKVVTFKKHNASSKIIHILNHAVQTIPFYANKQLKPRTADVVSSVCVEEWWAT
jgi:hypothetical protein